MEEMKEQEARIGNSVNHQRRHDATEGSAIRPQLRNEKHSVLWTVKSVALVRLVVA